MKVNVINVDGATFHPYRWWSNWIDVVVFDSGYRPYLLQMRVSRTNQKKFKAIRMCDADPSVREVGDLAPMARMEDLNRDQQHKAILPPPKTL